MAFYALAQYAFGWILASHTWQALADPKDCVNYQSSVRHPSFVARGQTHGDKEGAAPAAVESYRGDIWYGLIDMNYIIRSSSTLSLALDAKVEYIYTPSFLLKLFNKNPWLKYRVLDFSRKQELLREIQKRDSQKRWFSKQTPTEKITRLLADQFYNRLSSTNGQLPSPTAESDHRKELMQLLAAADVAGSISRAIKGSNTESVFLWIDSIKRNPFTTLAQVVAHSFNNSIGGFRSMSQQTLNQGCFAVAHKSSHILPLTNLFPGGILGKISQTMSQAFIGHFHPFLMPYKGVVSIVLAVLCRLGVPRIVQYIFTRLDRVKRRLGRSARGLWYKYIGLRGDPIGRKMLDDVLTRTGVVLITLLFQLHAVDVESVKSGARVQEALMAGGGVWALSDGLFVGLKDFGQLFKRLMSTYATVTTKTVVYCSGRAAYPDDEAELLEAFLNGSAASQQPASTRLSIWCKQNIPYLERLEKGLPSMTYRFGKQVVKVLRMHFSVFSEYFSNVMSTFYELTFSTLESDIRAAVAGHYARPDYRFEARKLVATQEMLARPKPGSELPRTIFRKPWMKVAIKKLASGYFLAANALSLLDLQESGDVNPEMRDASATAFRAYADLRTASTLVRSALDTIFGRFLHSQALISTAKGQKTRMKVFDFISKCQDRTASEHAEVCGEAVTTSIDETKFIAKSLLALNAGIAVDNEDIFLTRASVAERGRGITSVFADWRQWLLAHDRATPKKKESLVAYAEEVSSQDKVRWFIEMLKDSLEKRLRFYRFEVGSSGTLRLFDLDGKSALFAPRSESAMRNLLSQLKPDPLDAPAIFVPHDLNEGQLTFAQAEAAPIDGVLNYDVERRELKGIQHDALAVKDLLVAQLTNSLGRFKAEMVATLLLVLHRNIPQFRSSALTEFLENLSPKMLFDGVLILSDRPQFTSGSLALERSLYRYPLSMSSIMEITTSSIMNLVPRLASGDTSQLLSSFTVSVLHSAYLQIEKVRTGRTQVLELFQQSLLYVVDELDAGTLPKTFPECEFLLPSSGTVDFRTALKCALYRFQKLRSLTTPEESGKGILKRQVVAYLDAVVKYFERLKARTSWRTFLNIKAFRPFAASYKERAAKYTYEAIEKHINAHRSGSTDPVDLIQTLTNSCRDDVIPVEVGKGGKVVLSRMLAGISRVSGRISQRLQAALLAVQRKIVRTLGAESIPRSFRILNALSGAQFFGALEYAEFKVFPDTQALPEDFIRTTNLSFFGKLLLYLEPISLYLGNPNAMYNIVSEMRTMPLITPEAEEMMKEIRRKVHDMDIEDVRVATGYVASQSGNEGILTAKRALALIFLAKGDVSPQYTEILSSTNPAFLGFIMKVLDYPHIFKQMKVLSDEEAAKQFRFSPRGSLRVGFPFSRMILPVGERLSIMNALRRLRETGHLDELAAMVEERGKGREAGELECLKLYEEIKAREKTNSKGALRLWSLKVDIGEDKGMAGCALFFSLKEMQKSGLTETTVKELLQQQYHRGSPVSDILERIGSRKTKFGTRVTLMGDINTVLSVVYNIWTARGLDVLLNGYSSETGHLSFLSRETAEIADEPLYDLFSRVADVLEKNLSNIPEVFTINLSSYYAEEWLRFLEPDRLKRYLKGHDAGSSESSTLHSFEHVSSVYAYYDLIDYHISLRQRSVVPVDMILKSASKSLIKQLTRTLEAYGLATSNLDLGDEVRKAKLTCYSDTLTNYTEIIQKDRESQEMWKIDCIHDQLRREGSLSYSVGSLAPEKASLLISTIDNELKREIGDRYTRILGPNMDVELFKSKAWSFITLPHVSLRSASRLRANVNLIRILIDGFRRQAPWSAIGNAVGKTRENKVLSRQPHERGPKLYSSVERPYLYNPFQIALDLFVFFITNKLQRLRLPKMLLKKRVQVFGRLPFVRKRTFTRDTLYAEELRRSEQILSGI